MFILVLKITFLGLNLIYVVYRMVWVILKGACLLEVGKVEIQCKVVLGGGGGTYCWPVSSKKASYRRWQVIESYRETKLCSSLSMYVAKVNAWYNLFESEIICFPFPLLCSKYSFWLFELKERLFKVILTGIFVLGVWDNLSLMLLI